MKMIRFYISLALILIVAPAYAVEVKDVVCGKEAVGIFPIDKVVRIVDGDTQDILVNLGLDTFVVRRTRLLGVDTPETRGVETPQGEIAKAYTIKWFDDHKGQPLHLVYFGRGKFGRALSVIRAGSDFLNVDIITSGNHAAKHEGIPYCGGSRKAKPDVKKTD